MVILTSPTAQIILRRRSHTSFDTANIPGLTAWLQEHGYQPVPTHTSIEYVRLKCGSSLIILFHSSSVVVQGIDEEAALRLLERLEIQP